jgi:DNA-binding transcriptional MerR regulator
MIRQYHEIVLCQTEPEQLTLDMIASCADMHPALVERFVEFGLLEPVQRQDGRLFFDPSAIPRLRMIGRLRQSLGINLAGIAVVLELRNKVCELQRENELLRNQF